jgi:hypothetical protein
MVMVRYVDGVLLYMFAINVHKLRSTTFLENGQMTVAKERWNIV